MVTPGKVLGLGGRLQLEPELQQRRLQRQRLPAWLGHLPTGMSPQVQLLVLLTVLHSLQIRNHFSAKWSSFGHCTSTMYEVVSIKRCGACLVADVPTTFKLDSRKPGLTRHEKSCCEEENCTNAIHGMWGELKAPQGKVSRRS